ncbi:MAG: hypothetical protein ACHP84_00900 [Caulobacterales bacterium]
MAQISQSPFEWLQFDQNGALVTLAAPGALKQALTDSGASDLVIISHGWKTDQAGAESLYMPLWANVTASLKASGKLDPAKVVIGGVLWPSKQFQTDFDVADLKPVASGGALDVGAMAVAQDLDPATLSALIDQFIGFVGPGAAAVRDAAQANQDQFTSASARRLLGALRTAVGLSSMPSDVELAADAERLSNDPLTILNNLVDPPTLAVDPDAGGALSLVDSLQGALAGPRAAIGRLLNQVTYYEMKNRAGAVGDKLGADVLTQISPGAPTRLHLIGHSFGARLVTAAAAAFPGAPNLSLRSLTLLQGAFSHNALSAAFGSGDVGAYATVLASGKVAGPITITHTHNDSACTIAYALASRLALDVAKALGDKNDPFGAMGANGAQNLASGAWQEAQALAKNRPSYTVTPGLVNNVLGDACISEHMDVTNADVGALVASAIAT